ncbi:glutamine amidotransferase-related protein [Escherichia coli]
MADEAKRFYGVQFHPEVTHTRQGARTPEHFVKDICGCECLWTPATIIDDAVARIREQVGDDEVILGLSGGVDSSVVATWCTAPSAIASPASSSTAARCAPTPSR